MQTIFARTLRANAMRILISLLVACAAFAPPSAAAKGKAIYYYVPVEDAWTSFANHASQIPIVAPQVFLLDDTGTVHGAVEERVQLLARQHRIAIMPLLANDKPEAAHALLIDPHKQRQAIADALQRCEEAACIGLQLDLEGVSLDDGKAFTDFVGEAARAFHTRHLQLSVAVPTPLFQPSPGINYGMMFGGFVVMPQPYDLREIARAADFISLMTYGQYGAGMPPGPVAGYFWVEQSLRYALQFVPAKKLSMGLGFWAYRWCNDDVTYSGSGELEELAAGAGAVPQWHVWHRSPWVDFNLNGCPTVAWYENQRSLGEKLKLVKRYHLHGYSAWRLGQEDPHFWEGAK